MAEGDGTQRESGTSGLYCIDRVFSGVLHGRGQAGGLNTCMLRAGQVLWENMCATLDNRDECGKLAKGARGLGRKKDQGAYEKGGNCPINCNMSPARV